MRSHDSNLYLRVPLAEAEPHRREISSGYFFLSLLLFVKGAHNEYVPASHVAASCWQDRWEGH